MKRAILLIGMLLAFDVRADAFESGNTLADKCRGAAQREVTFPDGICLGYVTGIADVMAISPIGRSRACIPTSGTTKGQMVDIVVKHIREHPEELHYDAASLVAKALSTAFPCRK